MKKIINGIRYNTEAATLIGEYRSPHPTNDFSYWYAGLYRAPRSGRYFLAGEGGPMTRYAKRCGDNSVCGGEAITPLTEEDAFAWAQKYLEAEVVEEHFGDMIEDA